MFKKFMAFFLATAILLIAVGMMYLRYMIPSEYPVFIESFSHGVMTVDDNETKGSDNKYVVMCKPGETITININPERTDSNYYNLSKLIVNGENVTDQVSMLQYKTKVQEKLTVLAFFKKGKKPEKTKEDTSVEYNEPSILTKANTEYFGSENAYDFEDPSIIYDSKSEYYYCFGSGNKVMRSKDLLNWENRTTYFPTPENAESDHVMDFGEFVSVSKWAKSHGYDKDLSNSTSSNNREPIGPDIIKIGSYYYLYFSLSKSLNANESAIFCVRTTDLEYSVENKDWQDVGLVISTCGRNSESDKENPKYYYDASNAVHPSIFKDKDGGLFMAYGSYFGREIIQGGIYLLELNSKTGLLSKNEAYNSRGDEISTLHGKNRFHTGLLIAKPGKVPALGRKEGSLVTASDLIYDNSTGYYYMFVTYGDSQNNYNIRVARSQSVNGPYLDYNGQSMSKFGKSKSNNQYTKGLKLIGGYNFEMSSNGGVSYSDVGKASTGSPSIIKTADGKWVMASQSRVYYKVGDEIYTGEKEFDEEDEVKADMKPALEIRQIFFDENDWPIALAEAYTGEQAKSNIKQSQMNGNWDVIIFDNGASSENYKAIERSVSAPVTIMNSVAISETDIAQNTNLSKLKFEKKTKYSYEMLLDGVTYTIYPTIAWDWELDEGTLVFSGVGDDGSTIWGKKNYSSFVGISTDAFDYLLSFASDSVQSEYKEKMSEISSNPSQTAIDKMTKEVADIILAG